VNDVGEAAIRKREVDHIPAEEPNGRMVCKMRSLVAESLRIARQHDRRHPQVKLVVGPEQALQQPRADEPGAAGQK